MTYQQVAVLLPCHSLEDFPTHHAGEEAEGLLACWTALWHPALIASCRAMPAWYRADDPPAELANRLLAVPPVAENYLPSRFTQQVATGSGHVIRHRHRRSEVLAAALEPLQVAPDHPDPELVADFLALGYCYLQVELLTRQMRYSSHLDQVHFQNLLVAAAEAALRSERELAVDKLRACFDLLGEERDHYYPVDAYLLDLVLVAPTTLGPALRHQLTSEIPQNLLVSGEDLALMARQEPETLVALQEAIRAERVALLGGSVTEAPWPLMSCESILNGLEEGLAQYEQLAGARPFVYGRRRSGLTPALPLILYRTGFLGALHIALDDGRCPEGTQLKTRWEGLDGAVIDAMARPPRDAADAGTFLSLANRLGESMDMDHVAGLCLAHWPGLTSTWYDDLRRVARYTTALGKFITFDRFFRETDLPGHLDRFEADQYRSPDLRQAIIRQETDPISRWVRYWRAEAGRLALRSLQLMTTLVSGQARPADPLPTSDPLAEGEPSPDGTDAEVQERVLAAAREFASCLPHSPGTAARGCLVINPYTQIRRTGLQTAQLSSPPTPEPPVYAATAGEQGTEAVVDVPSLGYAWIAEGEAVPSRGRRNKEKPIAEETVLQNDFLEVRINPVTGSLQGVHAYGVRGNRLSQQLALRMPGHPHLHDGEEGPYSVMAADSVEITASSPVLGEITTRGRLLDRQGGVLARYRQTYRLGRGSRIVWLDVELEPEVEPRPDPWESYYACRFAWADESAAIWRSANQVRQRGTASQLEAPLYLEIEDATSRTTIFTGGLPYHRRSQYRMLDSLLIVRGERARRFQLGIGVDVVQPLQEALQALVPLPVLTLESAPPAPSSAWLLHIDVRNVVATTWSEIAVDGRVVGFRARLLEVTGRPAQFRLSCFRPVVHARQLDFLGDPISECRVDEGRIRLELAAYEWALVEAWFE